MREGVCLNVRGRQFALCVCVCVCVCGDKLNKKTEKVMSVTDTSGRKYMKNLAACQKLM